MHHSHKFDHSNDVNTTYLGSYMAKDEPGTFPVDNHIPLDSRSGTPLKLFLDSGTSRSYLSKKCYDSNPVLHDMPKFVTFRVKFQDDQGVVQFRNGSNETAKLRKNKAVGILDLRSIGYFKVGYQKMVNMAKTYHYEQINCKSKTEVDQ